MRVGVAIVNQNYSDWDRYEAEERGERVPDRPARSDLSIFREELEMARFGDEAGFDSVWTVEHHFTPYTMVTNPLQYLSYIGGITRNVDVGTMVVVLPWHNPVRVAEDAFMLDAMLGPGRDLILGVGRGLARREYAGLSIDQNEGRARYDESIAVLKQLLKDGTCTFEGKYWQIHNLHIRPRPEKDMTENFWSAGGSPETVEIIARHGVKPLMIPTTSLELSLQQARAYAGLRAQAGHPPTPTTLALWTYCAPTEQAAREGAERYIGEYGDSAMRHYELLETNFAGIKGYENYSLIQQAMNGDRAAMSKGFIAEHPYGTPDQIIEKVTRHAHAFGTREIAFLFKYGSMSIDAAMESMRLFTKEVLPELKKLDPQPIEAAAAA
jgi:alkanesulfonate monooxygenase SsuD/methylene tetrahydromethanopterin reductase-like flavin-dependent oxidoreductase (luciferase family)